MDFSFLETLIIVLLGLLFFKEYIFSFIAKWLGIEKKVEEEIPVWATQLMAYFNHDTTGHHEETHKKLDKVIDIVGKSHELLKQFDKFGVPCREKK